MLFDKLIELIIRALDHTLIVELMQEELKKLVDPIADFDTSLGKVCLMLIRGNICGRRHVIR